MKKLDYAILGAGAGGQSMAAILAAKGQRVKLYDINAEKIARLQQLGKIVVEGKIQTEGAPELITTDFAAAVSNADVIMVVTTTDAHPEIANKLAPFLKDGQVILLNPGHMGGAMVVSHIIRDIRQCKADVVIGEAGDLMYACRCTKIGFPFHSGIKEHTKVATLPAGDVGKLLQVIGEDFPNLVPAKSVIETGFRGGSAILHPIPTLMNINHMDNGEAYDYYIEGISPSIAKIMAKADEERVSVCKAFGADSTSTVKSLQKTYHLTQDDLYELIQNNKAYVGVPCPMNLNHRFIVEDILSALVPLSSLGHQLGIATPMLDAYIRIACVICSRDFWSEGRTVQSLGIAGKTPEEIYKMVS